MKTDLFRIRPYRESDERCVTNLWLRSYATSPIGKRRGANVPHSKAREEFWEEQGATCKALLEVFGARLLVDAQDEENVWAFACTSDGPLLHFVVAKNDFMPATREQFVRALVDITPALRVTQYCCDLRSLGADMPRHVYSHLLVPAILRRLKESQT